MSIDQQGVPKEHLAKFDESKCKIMQLYMKKLLENSGKVTVMVAGKSRTGKSTALNNLLGLKLPADYGARSVTQKVIVGSTTSQHGVPVCWIDTPGLKALDLETKKILDDMSEQIGQGVDNFTLLFCISLLNRVDDAAAEIMKNLTDRFGANIWKRCILVLTFCDTARSETNDCDENFKMRLSSHAKSFKEVLEKFIKDVPPVKLIFDCQDEAVSRTIIAVPVAKSREVGRDPNILPGFSIEGNLFWTEYVFLEIMRKSGKFSMPEIEEIKQQYDSSTAIAVAGLGVSIGVAIGGMGGPRGVAAGAVLGAAASYILFLATR